jgi:hypothetical protein
MIIHETVAEMIGMTGFWVSFFLNRLRDLGRIDYDCAGAESKHLFEGHAVVVRVATSPEAGHLLWTRSA